MSQASQFTKYLRVYVGLDVLPYQLALGGSLRRLEGIHARLYVGPLKLYVGLAREDHSRQADQ